MTGLPGKFPLTLARTFTLAPCVIVFIFHHRIRGEGADNALQIFSGKKGLYC
jgi:hypothetical protein